MSVSIWAAPAISRCSARIVPTFDGAATVEGSQLARPGGHVHECDLDGGHLGDEEPPPYDAWHLCRCLFRWP